MDIKFEDIKDFYINILKNINAYDMPFFHYHNSYEIFFIIEGKRKMIIHDKIYQGYSRDVFLIPPGYFHRTSGSGCVRIVINFSEEYLKKYFNRKMIDEILKCFDMYMISLSEKVFSELMEICNELIDEPPNIDNKKIPLKLAELLMILSENIDYNIQERHISNSMQLASDVLNYINRHYKELSDISQVAERFHVSGDHLCRIFKKYTGLTIISYINSLKIDSVRRLLLGTRKKLVEISAECGFSSASYMCKTFKKNYGCSPRDYRMENYEKNVIM